MAKKVTSEDGKTYKVKKPFYKRIWFWILAVVVVIAIAGGLGSQGNKNSGNKTTTSKTATSSSKKEGGKITRTEFDSIKLGDLMQNGNGGAKLDDLKSKFGNPSSTSSSTTNGVKTDLVTWTNVEGGWGANVIVSFTDGNAFSKNLTGFKLGRKQKITLADFNAFQNGTKYADFTSKWGQPDYYNESLIGGQKNVVAGYTSGVKGDLGSNFNVTFTNDALSGKTQSNMK